MVSISSNFKLSIFHDCVYVLNVLDCVQQMCLRNNLETSLLGGRSKIETCLNHILKYIEYKPRYKVGDPINMMGKQMR